MEQVERDFYQTLFEAIRKLMDSISTDEADEAGQIAGLAQAGVWMTQKCQARQAKPAPEFTSSTRLGGTA